MPPRLLYGLIELHVHPKPQSGSERFRLRVEAVFTITGHGTAVLGAPLAGQVRVGDQLRVAGRNGPTAEVVHIDVAPRVAADRVERGPTIGLVLSAFTQDDVAQGDELIAIQAPRQTH